MLRVIWHRLHGHHAYMGWDQHGVHPRYWCATVERTGPYEAIDLWHVRKGHRARLVHLPGVLRPLVRGRRLGDGGVVIFMFIGVGIMIIVAAVVVQHRSRR